MTDMTADFDGDYLSAKDYEEGARLVFTIDRASKERFENRKTGAEEFKWVLFFKEVKPGIVVNPGNGKTLLQLYGERQADGRLHLDTAALPGKRVAFLVTESPVGMYFKLLDKAPKESAAAI